jgi:hypothetical protein
MAIRRQVFDALDMRERWQGTLSDDFAMTRVVREAGMGVAFVPQALVASIERCTMAKLFRFTTRQMKITRVYSPRLWLMSLFGSLLFNGVMIASMILVFTAETGINAAAAIFTLAIVSLFSIQKAYIRLLTVRSILKLWGPELGRQILPQLIFTFLTPALFTYNSIAALLSRRVVWRGIKYELKSPDETVIIAD